MTKFYNIYLGRSDGKAAVYTRDNKLEPNEPTTKQMNQTPDKSGIADYYRELPFGEVKHLEWRRKLGGMLARELKVKDNSGHDSGYVLVSFPENYRLYEHVKKSEKEVKEEKAKSHAGGGNDRQDAYLYGHPSGRKKRFRSPADFFPHLLWLCTDESGDADNCTCKICCPEELEAATGAATKTKAESEVKMKKSTPKSEPAQLQAQSAASPSAAAPAILQPSQLPAPSTPDQRDDIYGQFKYRQGEMCWFRKSQAWGLGVILRRWQQNAIFYTIQPLSYPQNKHSSVTLSSDDDMRPWLAWSVPRYTHATLNDLIPPARYHSLDWQALVQGRYGTGGDIDVDASILAAKSIDCSYTPFNAEKAKEYQPGFSDTFYAGIYLGAEKIWKGEPVRMASETGLDIMVVHDIFERNVHGHIDQPQLVGDVYALTRVPHVDPRVPSLAAPKHNMHLPQRLTQDLAYRNARSIQMRQVAHYWKLTGTNVSVDISNIKGRWYEASLWLPILQPDAFRKMNDAGDIQELSQHLNARGDCLSANKDPPRIKPYNVRELTRMAALLQAVPTGAVIVDGSDVPDLSSMMDTSMDMSSGNDTNIDQFMNLDGSYY